MAESTLSVTIPDLRTAIADHQFGGTGDWSSLTADQKTRVKRILASGLRQFYAPPRIAINGRPVSHDWSFLWINTTLTHAAPYSTGTITVVDGVVTLSGGTFPSNAAACELTVSGREYSVASRDGNTQITLDDTTLDVAAGTSYSLAQNDYDLPDDFGSIVADSLAYAAGEDSRVRVRLVGEGRIRELRQDSVHVSESHPFLAAVRAKSNEADVGTRSEILFWPPVQQEAILTYRYRVRPSTSWTDYATGTVAIASGVVTLSAGTFPSWAAAGVLTVAGEVYTVNTRDGDTQITLDDTTAAASAGTSYTLTRYPFVYGASDHGETILASCLAAAERADRKEGVETAHFQRCLEASVDRDQRTNRPHFLGYFGDPGCPRDDFQSLRHGEPGVITYDGGA